MKKTISYFIGAVLLLQMALPMISCQSPTASALTESDQRYLRKAMNDAQDGWNKGNRNPYIDRYAVDVQFMPPNMETLVGKDAVRNFANSCPEAMVEFDVLDVGGSGDHAFVRGAYKINSPLDSLIDKGKFLSIWKRVDSNIWLLTNDIFNSDLPIAK
ncbi:MAG TPA: DUF4440 domain-containing protein [Cyclobacteriaceae bacterium]|nr:DUF4440 domain-containing protein [Cyclobacteriaceae bacterium]